MALNNPYLACRDDENIALASFYCACQNNDKVTLKLLLEKPFTTNILNEGLVGACSGGHRDNVELLIERGADDWDCGLEGACSGGHRDLVDLMITKGARIWNWGLFSAGQSGHRDLVNLMIEKGAYDWNLGLEGACRNGHRDIVDLLIEKGATELKWIVSHFNNDKRYIAHIALRLDKQRRFRFIDTLRQEKHDSTIVYLTNHHLIRCASSSKALQPVQTGKRILRNVLLQFVCTDVATWSCRFVGVCVFSLVKSKE